jgi:hypothetical protein
MPDPSRFCRMGRGLSAPTQQFGGSPLLQQGEAGLSVQRKRARAPNRCHSAPAPQPLSFRTRILGEESALSRSLGAHFALHL